MVEPHLFIFEPVGGTYWLVPDVLCSIIRNYKHCCLGKIEWVRTQSHDVYFQKVNDGKVYVLETFVRSKEWYIVVQTDINNKFTWLYHACYYLYIAAPIYLIHWSCVSHIFERECICQPLELKTK